MTLTSDKTVRDLALANPASVRVLDELGIDYCCGGGKSLKDVCAAADITVEELLQQIERSAERFPAAAGDVQWQTAPLSQLITHIETRHHGYVREALPRLERMSRKVSGEHGKNHPEVLHVERLFRLLIAELNPHMLKEEQVLFPYVRQMEAARDRGEPRPAAFFGTVQNPVRAMMQEHDGAGELLRQLRRVTADYRPPADACTTFAALYQGLEEFERDLHQHIHLENNILFPRALQMEAAVPVS